MNDTSSLHTWIELDSQAVAHNIALYKTIIGDKKLAVVVKSNAYGHGLIPIAQLLEGNDQVAMLQVAHLHEAMQLRTAGICKPILLLNPVRHNLEALTQHNLQSMVTDHDMIARLHEVAQQKNTPLLIHLKVDTGLSRFGFAPDEIVPLIKRIKSMPFLRISGIYTHFAESNNSDLAFTRHQAATFHGLIASIKATGYPIDFFHTSNSAGITSIAAHEDINLFRLGAGTYGFWPSEQVRTVNWQPGSYAHLQPVLTWKTRIVHIKNIPAGTFVGYNRTFVAPKPMRVAIVPVGYYEGYDKRLSNKGMVRVNGQSAPIIGTICMNATMIDISAIPEAHLDHEVILVGNEPNITPADLAQQTGCFNARQITVAINQDIPRIIR